MPRKQQIRFPNIPKICGLMILYFIWRCTQILVDLFTFKKKMRPGDAGYADMALNAEMFRRR